MRASASCECRAEPPLPASQQLRARSLSEFGFLSYPPAVMDEPEYLICLQCETPTYDFEFVNDKLATVICATCGNDDISDFMTEAELEEMM